MPDQKNQLRRSTDKKQNNKFLALKFCMLASSFLTSSVVSKVFAEDMSYKSVLGVSTTKSRTTNAKFSYLLPTSNDKKLLPLLDFKLSFPVLGDKSVGQELNTGVICRYNLDDKVILGAYSYFNKRFSKLKKHFSSSYDMGVEILTPYLDIRHNVYMPQKDSKLNTTRGEIING